MLNDRKKDTPPKVSLAPLDHCALCATTLKRRPRVPSCHKKYHKKHAEKLFLFYFLLFFSRSFFPCNKNGICYVPKVYQRIIFF